MVKFQIPKFGKYIFPTLPDEVLVKSLSGSPLHMDSKAPLAKTLCLQQRLLHQTSTVSFHFSLLCKAIYYVRQSTLTILDSQKEEVLLEN